MQLAVIWFSCGFVVLDLRVKGRIPRHFVVFVIARLKLNPVNRNLESRGFKIADGKYVSADATLIQSSRRLGKKYLSGETEPGQYETGEIEYDKDAAWVKKGPKSVYGYSATISTDEEKMVESVVTSAANESEMTNFPDTIRQASLVGRFYMIRA